MNTNHSHSLNGNHKMNGSLNGHKKTHPQTPAETTPEEVTVSTSSPTWAAPVVSALQRIATQLALAPAMTVKESHETIWKTSVPPGLAAACLAAAEKYPALIGPIFDQAGVADAVANAAQYASAANEARSLALHLDDEALRCRAKAGGDAWALYQTIRGIARTAKGAVLQDAVSTMRGIVRDWRAPRRAAKGSVKLPIAAAAAPLAAAATPAPAPAAVEALAAKTPPPNLQTG